VEIKNDNTINLKQNDQCIVVNIQSELLFKCGVNVDVEASSIRQLKDNNPCVVLTDKPKTFQFKANDERPWIRFKVNVN